MTQAQVRAARRKMKHDPRFKAKSAKGAHTIKIKSKKK